MTRSRLPWLVALVCAPQAIYACLGAKPLDVVDAIAIVLAAVALMAALLPD